MKPQNDTIPVSLYLQKSVEHRSCMLKTCLAEFFYVPFKFFYCLTLVFFITSHFDNTSHGSDNS